MSDEWREQSCDSEINDLKDRLNKALSKVNEEKSKFLSGEKSNKLEDTFDL